MNEEYDCDIPIDCLLDDPGCPERMWTHEQYCKSNKVGIVQIGQPTEHIPVDTGGFYGSPTCSFFLALSLLFFVAILFIKRGLDI